MRERYGALDERSLLCRFHTQTAGVSLTAHQPEINIARVAVQALAAALAGTQSLHTDSYDEALALPSEKAVRIALRTQQIIAHETGVASVADPLGGSEYVEWMTDEMERQAEEVFAHLLEIGDGSILEGTYEGIENGWFVGQIADSAYRFEREVNAGRRIVVGVNAFTDGNEDVAGDTLMIDPAVEEYQLRRLGNVKSERDDRAVAAALDALGACGRPRPEPHAAADRRRRRARDRGRDRRPSRCSARTSRRPSSDGRSGATRVVLAKLGLDGHDRGLKVVARILRDAGMEVVYLGLRQSPEGVASAVEQEDADAVGISMHNASHMTLAPMMVDALRDLGLETPVVIGGIILDRDVAALREAGVAAILGPGASAAEVADTVRQAVAARLS